MFQLQIVSERLPTDKQWWWLVAISYLMLVFFSRIWGLGFTHTDDAIWSLAARGRHLDIVSDFATSQGRIWAYVSGGIMYVALYLRDSLPGNLLRTGSMGLFFFLFYRVVALYTGGSIAFLAAVLNLALFTIRWEGSLTTTYPAFFWLLGSLFLFSVMLGGHYRRSSKRGFLAASLLAFFISMFLHEGATLLFFLLFILFALVPYSPSGTHAGGPVPQGKQWLAMRTLAAGGLFAGTAYALVYVAWRLAFPTGYAGNTIGNAELVKIPEVLFRLATGGTLISGFFAPMSVLFSDTIAGDGYKVVYDPWTFLKRPSADLVALTSMAVVAVATFSILGKGSTVTDAEQKFGNRAAFIGLVTGILVTFIPIFPVAAVEKYQRHFYDLGVTAYVFTVVSHFGITLSLASILFWVTRWGVHAGRYWGYALRAPLAAVIAIGAYCSCQMNDVIVNDMRVETYRWKAVDQAIAMDSMAQFKLGAIHAPRLSSGSWFSALDNAYWGRYSATVLKKPMRFVDDLPLTASQLQPTAFLDYSLEKNSRQLALVLAPLSFGPAGEVSVHQVALSVSGADVSDVQQYVLTFTDRFNGPSTRRFADLPQLDKTGNVRLATGLSAVPGSIRFARHSFIQSLPLICDRTQFFAGVVSFGTVLSQPQGECLGRLFLGAGWNTVEKAGVWSRSRDALVNIPTAGLPHGSLELTVKTGSYVGLGFGDATQNVSVLLNNEIVANRADAKGDGPKEMKITIPAFAWTEGRPLPITLRVDRTVTPPAGDTRALGVYLYFTKLRALP